jgi:putative ABC transport system permease protein
VISLAGRDILHSWGKFVLTGMGLGLLIGVTLTMAGVYRGMVDDARALLNNSGADLWVVQQGTQGPYAESSSLRDDTVRSVLGLPGVARAANVTYLTMQVRRASAGDAAPSSDNDDVRAMVVGFEPGQPGEPGYLVAGRHVTRSHYEAVADVRTGFALGERIRIRRHDYTVVGLTRRMVSSGGDPMVFIPLKDAQEAQFLKDNDAIVNERARTAANPSLNRPGVPGLLEAIQASQANNRNVNAILVQVQPGMDAGLSADTVAETVRRWKHLEAYTRAQMEEILVAKLIATSARQIGMFLVILAIVSAAIVAFIIYTMTLGKIREIAVLKLIGTRNRTIAGMILQQALGLGLIGFIVGKVAATFWAPIFPKYVLLEVNDALLGFLAVMVICALASTLAIRAALAVDPAAAIGGWHEGTREGPRHERSRHPHRRPAQALRRRRHGGRRAEGRQHGRGARRGGGPDRPLGLGQEHLAEVPGRRHRADGGAHDPRRADHLRRWLEDPRPARAAPRQHRLRVPGALPDPVPRCHRQRRLAADAGRAPQRRGARAGARAADRTGRGASRHGAAVRAVGR